MHTMLTAFNMVTTSFYTLMPIYVWLPFNITMTAFCVPNANLCIFEFASMTQFSFDWFLHSVCLDGFKLKLVCIKLTMQIIIVYAANFI